MAHRPDFIDLPGLNAEETTKRYEKQKLLPEWLIRLYFDLDRYTTRQRMMLKSCVERRLVRLDVSWSVKEHMAINAATAKCAPLTADIVRVADAQKVSNEEAKQILLKQEKTYELAGLPEDVIRLIEEGRMDVVIIGADRRARKNAKREDLRFRSFDLLNMLRLFKPEQNRIGISAIPKYERKNDNRRQRPRATQSFAMLTGAFTDKGFESITFIEQPTAEKRGLILVMPAKIIWHFGSMAVAKLAWTLTRFDAAIEAVHDFLGNIRPMKKENLSESKITEEEVDDEDDDPTPDPDLDESEETGGQEAPATAN